MGALDGVHVLDFTQVIMGPACTQVLADHGADVIKIERPGEGDLARAFGPWHRGESLAYASLNRGKRSVAVNIKAPEGKAVIERLLPKMDVLVHNFRPGVMERLGLDYSTTARRYPKLIYATGSGFGTRGPYAERGKGGHESLAQALSGLLAKCSGSEGPTRRLPVAVADFTAGMLLAQAILLALIARERTGRGQFVETSLLDGLMAMQAWETSALLNTVDQKPVDHAANPLDGAVYRTLDGHLMVTALFRANALEDLCVALGIENLSTDPRFATLEALVANADTLRARLEPVLATRPTAEWIPKLEAHDILCAAVRSTAEALCDPQLIANRLIIETEDPHRGKLRHIGTPLRLQGTPPAPSAVAPILGEHTDEVLKEHGFTADEIAMLRARKIIGSDPPA